MLIRLAGDNALAPYLPSGRRENGAKPEPPGN